MQVKQISLEGQNVEKERDFYFEKLHAIEALCEAPEYAHCRELANAVQAVLYHVRCKVQHQLKARVVQTQTAHVLF